MTYVNWNERKQQRRQEQWSKEDIALFEAMRDMPLKPGQMLLLGPRSVAMLTGKAKYQPPLPDKFVLERSEWASA